MIILLYIPILTTAYEHSLLYGDVEDLGYYYVEIQIGTPPKRQTVIIDTGSAITAFPCAGWDNWGEHLDKYFDLEKSSTSRIIRCGEEIPWSNPCKKDKNEEQWKYTQSYMEGSSIAGFLVQDYVYFGDEFSDRVEFIFGWHTKETNLFRTQAADGIMGLDMRSKKQPSLIDALYSHQNINTDIFAICLGKQNGLMTIGGYNDTLHESPIRYIGMYDDMYYSIKLEGMKVNGEDLRVPYNAFSTQGSHTTGTIIDSGTTFTYLKHDIYYALLERIKQICSDEKWWIGGTEANKYSNVCWKYDQGDYVNHEDFLDSFPIITLVIEEKFIYLDPQYYMWQNQDADNTYCLGFYSNGGSGNVIGMVTMRGMDFIFDREKNRIGIADSNWDLAHDGGWHEFAQISKEEEKEKAGILGLLMFLGLATTIALMIVGIWAALYSYWCESGRDYVIKEDEVAPEEISSDYN